MLLVSNNLQYSRLYIYCCPLRLTTCVVDRFTNDISLYSQTNYSAISLSFVYDLKGSKNERLLLDTYHVTKKSNFHNFESLQSFNSLNSQFPVFQ